MNKIIFIFLLAALLIFSAAGCVAGESANSDISEPISDTIQANEPLSMSEAASDLQSSAAASIAEEPTPDNSWEFDIPKNHAVNGELLAKLHEVAAKESGIHSIITVKDGYIIDEYYSEEYNESSVFRLASCSKSFSGALIGIAIDQGILTGTDAKLVEFFPQLADDAAKQEITIENLLTHTSGIEWYEWNGGNSFGLLNRSENWIDYIFSQSMTSEPGAVFNYTTGGSHLLAAVLQEATGEIAYEFGLKHLFEPMGMDSVEWRTDPQGFTDGGNGISMTARDAAKFGQLYLDGGKWKDRQIISEAWVEESVKVQFARSSNSGSYGYQWWLRPFGEGNYDTYYAMGHGGQYIFVVPELRLVTVITSRFQDTYAPWPYFTDYVLAACG